MNDAFPVHKLKTKAKILLCSVFGPYSKKDEYGSMESNSIELYHNQVTRVQGAMSLRMFHRSFGLMMIQENIDAPTTLLDFPTRDRFIEELKTKKYDIIGISSIIPNFPKLKEMCRLIREIQPDATIVVGGHIANIGNLKERVGADYVVRGEGIRWFRKFLGQDENAPIKHTAVLSCFGARMMGIKLSNKPRDTAAILIPSVGCPVGCNFCSTSALFGGKGKSIHFYETGDQLFEVMDGLEKKLGVNSFFALDENFLLHKNRAHRLMELMKKHDKSWAIFIFSSARILRHYTMEELLSLGISWVWMGIEGKNSQYDKLHGIDTKEFIRELQENGIRVLGSSIIGLEDHSAENISEVIDHAVAHNSVFHQFMLYTPTEGTPFYEEMKAKGLLLPESECSLSDANGQYRLNYRHKFIEKGKEEEYLIEAFNRDFKVNGPSVARLVRTTFDGYMKHKNHPDERIRRRIRRDAKDLAFSFAGTIWALRKKFHDDPKTRKDMDILLKEIYREFGLKTRMVAPLIGLYIYSSIGKEEERLAKGWTYEPPTFYELNAAALSLRDK
ncbi:MAG TPA: B12-binding domain-containing radical SAM protein [Lentisphaeria bacterium]|nr:MAG: hypothetical protein A2X48_13365 [Lentisphaerae bacterium GWF2_49_21]HBC88729.1 B12-binding domain-containing radical SAM protein [Lentisphaeria bacterium]